MKKVVLELEKVNTISDSFNLEKYLTKKKEIKEININLKNNTITIIYNDIDFNDIERYLIDYGYKNINIDLVTTTQNKSKMAIIIYGILLIIPLLLSITNYIKLPFLTEKRYLHILLLLSTLYIVYGYDIISNGIKNIIKGRSNLDTLLTISIITVYIFNIYNFFNNNSNYYLEIIIFIIYIQKLSYYVINRIQEKVESDIKQISKTEINKAIIDNKELNINEIRENDCITLFPGDKALLDGVLKNGISHFDESIVNGSSAPINKENGCSIISGSINCDEKIEYIVNRTSKESYTNKIKRLILEEKNNKIDYQTRVDRFCNYFSPIIIIAVVITFSLSLLITKDLSNSIELALIILLITSSFSLSLITPIAIKIQNKYCMKKGLLIRNSKFLENKKKIDTIVFDKTATLTNGYLSISKINNHSDLSNKELLEILGSIEKHSTHIIARGITKYLRAEKIKAKYDFISENIVGYGVKSKDDDNIYYACNSKLLDKLDIINSYKEEEKKLKSEGNIVIYLIKNNKILATFGVKDTIKKDAKKVIKSLQDKKLDIILLSGDSEEVTNKIANQLEITKVFANADYEFKYNFVKKLEQEKKRVMYVGDGLNDAPSLMTATFGVALKNSYLIPSAAADIIITNDNLNRVNDILTISKKTRKCIKINIIISLIYMLISLLLLINIIPIKLSSLIIISIMIINSITIFITTLRLKHK